MQTHFRLRHPYLILTSSSLTPESTPKHHFCKTCGVQSFYKPRSNPNGVGITVYCIDDADKGVLRLEKAGFDGQNWEQTYAGSTGSQIKAFSKKKEEE